MAIVYDNGRREDTVDPWSQTAILIVLRSRGGASCRGVDDNISRFARNDPEPQEDQTDGPVGVFLTTIRGCRTQDDKARGGGSHLCRWKKSDRRT